MQETTTDQEILPPAPMAQEPTVRLSREDLQEGWAEMGRKPRFIATLKMGAKTDLGRVRENNEDKFDFFEPEDPAVLATKGMFYAVADGMGGHSAGQVACELALKTVIQAYYSTPTSDVEAGLRHAIEEANAVVYETAQAISDRQGMGTTLTAAIVRDNQLTIAQVGDSRAYLLRAGQLSQITDDHSWVAEQVRLGIMTHDEASSSPFRNIITRSVGTSQTVDPDISTQALQVGDTLLLCSDGLTGYLEPPELSAIVGGHSPSDAAMRLVEEANRLGGRDNITALILSVRALTPAASGEEAKNETSDSEETDAKPEKRSWGRRK